jgi:membrane protease YdiL (CAAX protease family)
VRRGRASPSRSTEEPSAEQAQKSEDGAVRHQTTASLVYRFAWVFYLILAIAGALWVGRRQGAIHTGLFVDPGEWWVDALVGVVVGGLLVVFWRLLRRKLASARHLEAQLSELLGPLQRPEIVGLAMLSGFAEELFFRGAVQGAWGWFPATVLFALLHSGPGSSYRAWTVFAGVAGLALAGLMLWRGNLLAPVVAHVLVNAVNLDQLARGHEPKPE